jgi:uncharacterized phage protein (TIGR02218 family)
MGITIAAGNLGEVKRQGVAFSAEFRSIANRLNQKIGQTYERTCAVKLGDSRCKIDLTAPAYRGSTVAETRGLAAQIVAARCLAPHAAARCPTLFLEGRTEGPHRCYPNTT